MGQGTDKDEKGKREVIPWHFWAPKHSCTFFGDPVLPDNLFNIFLNEAIAILATIHWMSTLHPVPSWLAIHTDSSNSFNMFNSLCVSEPYNSVLMLATSIWIEHGIDLHVFFIEGKCNVITDALSHCSFDIIQKLVLDTHICCFMPPTSPTMLVMGAYPKWTLASPHWPNNVSICVGPWGLSMSSGCSLSVLQLNAPLCTLILLLHFVHQLLQPAQLPHWTNSGEALLLHCIHVTPHQTNIHEIVPLGHLCWTRAFLPWHLVYLLIKTH